MAEPVRAHGPGHLGGGAGLGHDAGHAATIEAGPLASEAMKQRPGLGASVAYPGGEGVEHSAGHGERHGLSLALAGYGDRSPVGVEVGQVEGDQLPTA